MKKYTLVLIVALSLTTVAVAQDKSTTSAKNTEESIYTSLKPADGQPAIFNSREELESKMQEKKDKTIALIKENAADPEKVKMYREQLWRFENAIVEQPK